MLLVHCRSLQGSLFGRAVALFHTPTCHSKQYGIGTSPHRSGCVVLLFHAALIFLQAVGVELDSHGAIKVDDFSATGVPGIWAIGDVTNRVNLTPVALMEGMAFVKSCFGGQMTKPDYQNVASAVFCQPPLASVG